MVQVIIFIKTVVHLIFGDIVIQQCIWT